MIYSVTSYITPCTPFAPRVPRVPHPLRNPNLYIPSPCRLVSEFVLNLQTGGSNILDKEVSGQCKEWSW